MKRKDGILWRAALEDLFDDFLRFFYPGADGLFDSDKGFQYLDKVLNNCFHRKKVTMLQARCPQHSDCL